MEFYEIETKRLRMRPLSAADLDDLREILQDEETMTYYEGAFSEAETRDWLRRMMDRFEKDGISLFAVIEKKSGKLIGQCGLTWQGWNGRKVLEAGYLFNRKYWHQGFSREAAKAWIEYAFNILQAEEVCSIIRDTNTASQKVALANGLTPADHWTKHYRNTDMPHTRYVLQNPKFDFADLENENRKEEGSS